MGFIGALPDLVWQHVISFCSHSTSSRLSQVSVALHNETKKIISFKSCLYGYWGFIFYSSGHHYASANLDLGANDTFEGEGVSTISSTADTIQVFGFRDRNILTATMYFEGEYEKKRGRFASIQLEMIYNQVLEEYVMYGFFAAKYIHGFTSPMMGAKASSKFKESSKEIFMLVSTQFRVNRLQGAAKEEAKKQYADELACQEKLNFFKNMEDHEIPENLNKMIGTWKFSLILPEETIEIDIEVKNKNCGAMGEFEKSKRNGEEWKSGDLMCSVGDSAVSIAIAIHSSPTHHIYNAMCFWRENSLVGRLVQMDPNNCKTCGTLEGIFVQP